MQPQSIHPPARRVVAPDGVEGDEVEGGKGGRVLAGVSDQWPPAEGVDDQRVGQRDQEVGPEVDLHRHGEGPRPHLLGKHLGEQQPRYGPEAHLLVGVGGGVVGVVSVVVKVKKDRKKGRKKACGKGNATRQAVTTAVVAAVAAGRRRRRERSRDTKREA